jgi:hypothetical protein
MTLRNIIAFDGKEIDSEGYYKTVVFWTTEDGKIKMDVAEGFGKENLILLLKIALKEIK